MKVNALFVLMTAAVLFTGCASVAPQGGLIFHDVKYPVTATSLSEGTKRGEACTNSVLGLVGSGDASIEAAKRNGGITKVTSVDANSWSLLFFYNKFCTIVHGN